MKKWILYIWIVGVFGMLAASCVMDDVIAENDTSENREKVYIRFTIAVNEATATSRTTWEGYDPETGNKGEVGQGYENYINPNTVQVLLYDLDGRLMNKLKDVKVASESSVTDGHVYKLTGSFEADADEVTNLSFKMMVFVNCPTLTNLNDFYNLSYNYEGWTQDKGIPMWGIATYSGIDLSNSTSTAENVLKVLKDPVYMLRSMAKIEVTLHSQTIEAGYKLTGATLHQTLNSGYVLPAYKDANDNTLTLKELSKTTDLGVENVLHAVKATPDNVEAAGFTQKTENTTYVIYVPEYEMSEGNSTPYISLNLEDGNGNTVLKDNTSSELFTFEHGYYENGIYQNQPWNIVRNHYYKYTVNIMNDLDLAVSVCPYGSFDLRPVFGL